MPEDVEIRADLIRPRTSKEAYLSLLGVENVQVPEIGMFPEIVTIPSNIIPGFFEAIEETNKDGRERGAVVRWNSSTKEPFSTTIKIGTGDEIWLASIPNAMGFGRKKLISWHTHPPQESFFTPATSLSDADVRSTIALQKHVFIDGIGSKDGGMFAFQSETASKTPFSSTQKALEAEAIYRSSLNTVAYKQKFLSLVQQKLDAEEQGDSLGIKRAFESISLIEQQVISDVLKNFGYETYVWLPEENQETNNLLLRRIDTVTSNT